MLCSASLFLIDDIDLPPGKVLELSKTIGSIDYSEEEEEASEEEIGKFKDASEVKNEDGFKTLKIVTSTGNIANTRFKASVTAKKVKEVMANILNTTPDCLSLSLDRHPIGDDTFVKDLNINDDNYIYCQKTPQKLKAIQNLVLQLEDGTRVKSKFRSTTTVKKVKEVLSSMLKTPPSGLILSYKGSILQDNILISNLDISDDRFIFVQKKKI